MHGRRQICLVYGRPVDEVEAEIRSLLEGEPEDRSAVGRRRRSER
jgi:hypothetical protein